LGERKDRRRPNDIKAQHCNAILIK
jgi:hypothetical protein